MRKFQLNTEPNKLGLRARDSCRLVPGPGRAHLVRTENIRPLGIPLGGSGEVRSKLQQDMQALLCFYIKSLRKVNSLVQGTISELNRAYLASKPMLFLCVTAHCLPLGMNLGRLPKET